MTEICKVVKLFKSELNNCFAVVLEANDEGLETYAAVTDNVVHIKPGDLVEVYSDRFVNYRGYGAMVMKVVNDKDFFNALKQAAMMAGCDVDGDIVILGRKKYFINIFNETYEFLGENNSI